MSKSAAFLRGQGAPAKRKAKPRNGRGQCIPTMIYPRPKTRELIVNTALAEEVRVSNFFIMAALEKIARQRKTTVETLIPKIEFDELQRVRGKQ